jgi:hypothetical protein
VTETKFRSPLKIGLLTVAAAYFLFTLHALLTVSWVGEWERLGTTLGFVIFVEDIGATAGMVFRFVASLVAFVGVVVYFKKKGLPAQTMRRLLMVILVGEAIYWLGLLPSGIMPIIYLRPSQPPLSVLTSLVSSDIPCLVESTAIPIALTVLATKMRSSKPTREAIKWALISGTVYVFSFWFVNTGIWISTLRQKGITYLTMYPENLVAFLLTVVGVLALFVFTARFAWKSSGAESWDALNLKTVGTLITLLGLWFLWNYLTWISFGSDELWSAWYARFLGHNLDLWLLSIPLVGLPLSYSKREKPQQQETEGIIVQERNC